MDMFWRWLAVIGVVEVVFLFVANEMNEKTKDGFWLNFTVTQLVIFLIAGGVWALAWGLSGILGC